jgi:type II secretory pathway component PulF
MTVLGAGLLWFGWFGFNAGSALTAGGLAASAFIVTNTAAAAATLTWVGASYLQHRKVSVVGAACGAVAGLVAITPASGFVTPGGAIVIGLVAGAGVLAIGILITVVLPRFAKILADLGQTLPASTRAVLRGAAAVHAGLVPSAIGAAIGVALWRAWTQTESGRRGWHRLLLSVPLLGSIRSGTAAARMAHSLSALLESGVSMGTALVFAARATSDAELEARLTLARGAVTAGEPLSRALELHGATTPTVVRLIRAGEESGRLPAMLDHAARIEQQRADRIVRAGVRLLEPMLLLTFASVVALIAAALLQAIYSVRPTA